MPKYNERVVTTSVDTTHYEYAHRVELLHPLNGAPKVVFHTSRVEVDSEGNEEQKEYIRTLQETYVSNEVFDVIHPSTGEVVGQADYDTLLGLIYSLFFHTAAKEDSDVNVV